MRQHCLTVFHTLSYQIKGGDGSFSNIVQRQFYKMAPVSAMTYRCWVDDDYTTLSSGTFTNAPFLIDVSNVDDGFHVLHLQLEGNAPTPLITKPFLKIPQTDDVDYLTCLFLIDGKIFQEKKLPSSKGIINWELDASALTQVFHQAQVQVVTPSGTATNVQNISFFRTTTNDEMDGLHLVYSIDGSEYHTETGNIGDGIFHCDLDMSSLDDGLHRISYMLTNGKGINTEIRTQHFMKIPLGGYGIMRYVYWINNDEEHLHDVTLSQRVNPLTLMTLLPVETQPIRSSCFHFEVKGDKPMIYAKNDFHIRFYDADRRFTDESALFVDYSVKQEVEPVGELQATQTFNKIAANDIRWYTVNAEAGDSLVFKSSQATTIQLFSPSCEELCCISSTESVSYGGAHTWESGTHYLAIHDVTGTRPTMTLDYKHIDKYAVLEQDVTRVGNGGYSTITFKGNGFRDLYAVDLYNTRGDTVKSIVIGHESNTTTTVTFDFTDEALGQYNVLFHFTTEDRNFGQITVEEAVDIELAKTVTFPSAFPHGLSTTYTVKITNSGNMTAYSVPIYTWIMNKQKKNGIYHIKYEGLDLPGIFDGVDMDSLSASDRAELQAMSESMGDGHYFMLFRAEDEDSPGDSVWVRSNYFFTNIAPYETKTLRLTISADEGVWAYFTIPED